MTQAITRSVWSFWTKPFYAHRQSIWFSEKHHLLAWILSLETARKHYPETSLITDDAGGEILVDGIGLDFNSVSTTLNILSNHDSDWWAIGKLYAYRLQTQPFIHLDSDVFIWKALPEQVISSPILAQNPECFTFGSQDGLGSYYRPELYDKALKSINGWMPEEFEWYVAQRGNEAFCCGILGGTNVKFITHYADTAIQMIEHPHNQAATFLLGDRKVDNMLMEQYMLAACLKYHENTLNSPYHDIYIRCVFDSWVDAQDKAKEIGFTHLLGDAKRNENIAKRLEKRVEQDYPNHYRRCLRYLGRLPIYMGSDHYEAFTNSTKVENLSNTADYSLHVASQSSLSSKTRRPDELNCVISASWHHDQVMTKEDFTYFVNSIGLIILFSKPVLVDSLHERSICLYSQTETGEQRLLQSSIQPVEVTDIAPQSIHLLVGNLQVKDHFDLITSVQPLENTMITKAIRILPELSNWLEATNSSSKSITVQLRGDWILTEESQFTLNSDFEEYLAQLSISSEVNQQFNLHNIYLSENTFIFSIMQGSQWRLIDKENKQTFVIKKEQEQLRIYQLRALDGNNIWPSVPERPSGNGTEGGDWISIIHVI